MRLLAPVEPPTVICVGANYASRVAGAPQLDAQGPGHFLKLAQTLIGPGDVVRYPKQTAKLDYESELAIVIGRAAKDIAVEDAYNYVFEYTVINDMSIRWQLRSLPNGTTTHVTGVSKSFDDAAPLGPWIVTRDEIADVHALRVQCLVNGIVRQDDNTENFMYEVPQIVEFFSRFLTLLPGTVIATGACGGHAFSMDPDFGGTWPRPEGLEGDPYLHPGDRVDCVVDGIGTLTNVIGERA